MNPGMNNKWVINALRAHHRDYLDDIESFTDEHVKSQWDDFVSSLGCTERHGQDCFINLKREYLEMISRAPIVQELRALVTATSSVQSVITLKNQLASCYPNEPMYKDKDQHGAAEAFVHLLLSVPTLEKEYLIYGRKLVKCLECNKETVKDISTSYINLDQEVVHHMTLQDAINQWCNDSSEYQQRCLCTAYEKGVFIADSQQRRSTDHSDNFQINY